jgi:hypothetical protein
MVFEEDDPDPKKEIVGDIRTSSSNLKAKAKPIFWFSLFIMKLLYI